MGGLAGLLFISAAHSNVEVVREDCRGWRNFAVALFAAFLLAWLIAGTSQLYFIPSSAPRRRQQLLAISPFKLATRHRPLAV